MYMCNVNTDSHHRVLIIKIVHTIRIFRLRLLTRLQGWYAFVTLWSTYIYCKQRLSNCLSFMQKISIWLNLSYYIFRQILSFCLSFKPKFNDQYVIICWCTQNPLNHLNFSMAFLWWWRNKASQYFWWIISELYVSSHVVPSLWALIGTIANERFTYFKC